MALLGGSSRREAGRNFKFLSIGGGDLVYRVRKVTVAVDPANIATGTTKAGTAVTVAGVAAGDLVLAVPPTDLEDDLVPAGAVVTNTDEVTIYLYNASAGAVNGASKNWTLFVIEFS